jgi:hypothetical protein
MSLNHQNRLWVALLALMASFLWTTQSARDWQLQLDGSGYAQRGDIGFAQVIEPDRSHTGREFNPERRPESPGLAAFYATVEASFFRNRIRPGSTPVTGDIQPVALPAIRAPPQFPIPA